MRIDIVAAADHRPHRAVAVERDQRALCAARGVLAAIAAVGGALHAGSSVVQTSIGSLVSSISVSSCGSAQSVK